MTYTPYATSRPYNGHQLNPNNWANEDLAKDIMPISAIIIPLVDFEMTQDGGKSWMRFWRHENGGNDYPGCGSFDVLDADNFCIWIASQFAVTHDGGKSWIIGESAANIRDYSGCQRN